MRNIPQANVNALCCEQAQIKSAGLSLTIPTLRLNTAWRPFQSSIVQAFVRRQRREALRARLIERALGGGHGSDE